jgi:HEAT repeat protein
LETPEVPSPPPPAPEPGEAAPERQTTPFLVLQFFIFPMAIVAVCVTVFVIFGLIASEGRSARDYLGEVRSGSQNRRWQAAFELSKLLQAKKDPAVNDPRFVSEAVKLFEDSASDDPRVRRYLALALGRLGDPRAVPALRKALDAGASGDSETVIYSIWALGAIGDPAAVPDLVRLSASEDRGLRKAAVHALGVFEDQAAHDALAAALSDAIDDVRWNAALALGRRGDVAAAPMLLQMLDRSALAKLESTAPEQKAEALSADQAEEVMLQAAAVAARVKDPAVTAALEALRDKDPSLKVREAARVALLPRP